MRLYFSNVILGRRKNTHWMFALSLSGQFIYHSSMCNIYNTGGFPAIKSPGVSAVIAKCYDRCNTNNLYGMTSNHNSIKCLQE